MTDRIRLLCAEDDPQDAELIRSRFAAETAGFALEIVGTGQACLERLRESEFDLLLLGNLLPDKDGLEVLRTLVHVGLRVPVVLLTAVGDEKVGVEALRLGAVDFIPRDVDYLDVLPTLLRREFEEQLRRKGQGNPSVAVPRRILYVEHDPMDIELSLKHFAESAPHFRVEVCRSSAEALLNLAKPDAYDLALIDLRMPGLSGLDFVRKARQRGLELPPFIVISGRDDDATAIATLRLGAVDCIAKREGYLEQLVHTIDHAIDFDRLRRLNAQLQGELIERRRMDAELQKTQHQLERAVEAGRVGLFDWDLRSNRVKYSPLWKSQIGYAEDEIGSELEEWRSRVHPEDLARAAEIGQAYLDGVFPEYEQTYRFRHKDGSYRHILLRGALEHDEAGKAMRLVGTHVDITERTLLQQQLLQVQKMESVGRLAGGIAHDFNNLLTVIISTTEFASDALGEGHPARDDLLEIRRTAERAAALTHQLLAFSRRQILQPVVLDLNAVVTEMGTMLHRILGEQIHLAFKLAPDLGVVRADRTQVAQILLNLAVNARDAMPAGGSLTTETRNVELDEVIAATHPPMTPGPYVMLAVSDTGAGMDEETQAHIFEPFFTTKGGDKGSGLGLSTVHGVVEQSGGIIRVYSEPGRGTIFRIYLPRVRELSDATKLPQRLASSLGDETILLVEDDAALRQVASRILRTAGYTVLAAESGSEALALVENHPEKIALLLTDVVLPGMSGPELASQLKKSRPDMQLLFTSGFTDDAVVRDNVKDSAIAFIGKPYSVGELTRKVREVIDAASARPSGG